MNRCRLFRMLLFLAFFPPLLMSTPADGDQGGRHDAGHGSHAAPSAETVSTPTTTSSIWAQMTAKRDAIARLLRSKQLKGIHDEAKGLETFGAELVKKSAMLDEDKLARVRGAVNQMARVADSLHDAADKGDGAGAAAEFEKLEGLLKVIEAQYPAGALSSKAEEDGAGAPADPKEMTATDSHAQHDHDHTKKEPEQPIPPDAQRVLIQANDFKFSPTRIPVRAVRPVAVTLTNRGASAHDWVITSKPEVHIHVLPGQSETRMFTFDTPAEYSVLCTLPGHRELGMVGKLVIRGVSS